MTDKELKKLKADMTERKKSSVIPSRDFLSTGSTLLNLACSGISKGGFAKGKFYFLVGDSTSGKTFLSMTCLAEASINPNFDNYRFIYDNTEDGMLIDVERYFGKKVRDKLEPPATEKGEPVFSTTIEDFYYNFDDAYKSGKPFIYILDSMDALDTEDDQNKFDSNKEAHRKGTKKSGSYGMSKAKANSQGLRTVVPKLRETGSILIVVSQTRDNVGFGFNEKTRAGGKALRFYATLELWTSVLKTLKKDIRGNSLEMGVSVQIKIKKNRITGKKREVVIPIYHGDGIDDLGSCVDFLTEWNHWPKQKSGIHAKELDVTLPREKLIRHIEENDLEPRLRLAVGSVWNDIEQETELGRKKRYT